MKYTNNADLKSPLIDLEASNMVTGGKQHDSVQPERLSEESNIYCIYWIHLPEHTDVYSEGYIGFTSDFKSRMKSHRKSKKNTHFNYAKLKYKWNYLIKTVLYKNLTLEQALSFEANYRPYQNIGWNLQKGGELGVEKEWYTIFENRIKHSLNTSKGTIKGIKEKDTFEKRSLRAKLSRIDNKNSYILTNVGSNNHKAILNEEQVKYIKFDLLNKMTISEIAKMYNVKNYVIRFIKSGKTWKHVTCDSPDHK